MLKYDSYDSPLGTLYLVFSKQNLVSVSFEKPSNIPCRKGCAPSGFTRQLDNYFSGRDSGFNLKIQLLTGTDFEKKVWSSLRNIPFGETRSYKWLAEKIGHPLATRAVGQALSKNPLPIVLPCHRVIESDGSLGGFSSGVRNKRRLLDLEYYALSNKRKTD